MGRYYDTAKPTFVDDVIYQAPYELIARALQNKDLEVEEDEGEIDEFKILGDDKKYTKQDKERRNQILDEYRGEATSIAEQIQQDPQNRNYYMRKISEARKKFDKEINTGFLNDADRNFTRREVSRTQILERTDIDADQRNTALAQLDHLFKGSDSDSERDNMFSENFHIYEALDEEKFIKDKKAELVANSTKTNTTKTSGRYFTTTSGERRFISDTRLDESFENSTGVGKWEKALLQKLEWKKAQGLLPEGKTIDSIFTEERELFKQDYIKSLGFEQTAEGLNMTRDTTYLAEKKDKREEEDKDIFEETGKVVINRNIIPVPIENRTKEDDNSARYNAEAKKLKDKIREDLIAKYTSPPEPVVGEGPLDRPQLDEESLNQEVDEIFNERIEIFKLPVKKRRETVNLMLKEGYTTDEITDLINYSNAKEEMYDSGKMDKDEKKTFKRSTYPTIPPTLKGQVTFPDGTVKNMTKAEFETEAATLLAVKKKVDTPSFVKEGGKKYAAFKASNGTLIKITTKDKKGVLLADYDGNTVYQGGHKVHIEKVAETVGVIKPFDIKNMNISTTDKVIVDSPTQEGVLSTKINIHVKTSEGPMIFRLNRADVNLYEQ